MEFIFVAVLNLNLIFFPSVIIVMTYWMLGKKLLWKVIKISLLPRKLQASVIGIKISSLSFFSSLFKRWRSPTETNWGLINSCNSEQLGLRETNNILFPQLCSLTLYGMGGGDKMATVNFKFLLLQFSNLRVKKLFFFRFRIYKPENGDLIRLVCVISSVTATIHSGQFL